MLGTDIVLTRKGRRALREVTRKAVKLAREAREKGNTDSESFFCFLAILGSETTPKEMKFLDTPEIKQIRKSLKRSLQEDVREENFGDLLANLQAEIEQVVSRRN